MRLHLLLAMIVGLPGAVSARAEIVRGMNEEKIREAIAFGRNAATELEQYDLLRERAYLVNFDTPFLRVAQLARALQAQNSALLEDAVSPRVTAEVVNLYVHARWEANQTEAYPEVEQVVISRPRDGLPPQLVMPSSFQSYVRRVPVSADYDGPARLARSVKAVFPIDALTAGAELRIRFLGGATQVVRLAPEQLSGVR
jgi:hypothetical protein